MEVREADPRTVLSVLLRTLAVWRGRPLCCRALPLLKVISTRLDGLSLQHEPGVFQDGLAHLQRHTAKEPRLLTTVTSWDTEGLGAECTFQQANGFRINRPHWKGGGGRD